MAESEASEQSASKRPSKAKLRRAKIAAWSSKGYMGDLAPAIPEYLRGVGKLGGRIIRRIEDIPSEEWKALAEGTWRPPPLIFGPEDYAPGEPLDERFENIFPDTEEKAQQRE